MSGGTGSGEVGPAGRRPAASAGGSRRRLAAGAGALAVGILAVGLLLGPSLGLQETGAAAPSGQNIGAGPAGAASTTPAARTVAGRPRLSPDATGSGTSAGTWDATPVASQLNRTTCAALPKPHLRGTVVPMLFPLPASVRARYVDGFLAPRIGVVYPYENIRGVASDGTLLRAHDGVDVHAPLGTPVLAPFAGTVIDPASRWRPWDPARYGRTVAIVSTEACSRGYAVILVHQSVVFVHPGQGVRRGQRVGLLGTTGNAGGLPPHVHVEIRAPVLLRVTEGGLPRRIDTIDPFPSLVAADPHR